MVAQDGFLPRAFAMPGRRLVYSVGVLFLAVGAGLLLIGFGGITDRLIPLFAIGAFLSFTLSQAGMAAHWRRALNPGAASFDRSRRRAWHETSHASRARLVVNGGGALATGIALAVILVAKFTEGAWITLLVIPATLGLLRLTRHYYDDVDREVLTGSRRRLALRDHVSPVVLIPIQRWDRVAQKAVAYALRLSDDVTALHLTELEGPEAEEHEVGLRRDWRRFVQQPAREAGLAPPRLIVASSPYRSVLGPLLRAVQAAREQHRDRPIAVVLPQLVEARWWETLLHTHRERRLRAALLRHGGPDVAVVTVPWQLAPAEPEQVIAAEEPAAV